MIKLVGILVLIFFSTGVQSQDRVTDSLKHLLYITQGDTSKVKILSRLCSIYEWTKPDSAIKYGMQGRQLAQEIHDVDGELDIAYSLSEALSSSGNFSMALDISLHALQLAEDHDKLNIFSYALTGDVYFYAGDYSRALEYYLKAKQIDAHSSELIMGFIGETYFHLGQMDSSLYYINKAYQMDKHDSVFHWSVPYFYMASIDTKKGKYQKALDNYTEGLLHSKNANLDVANGYIGIASVLKQIGQIDSSIHYAKTAIIIAQKESLIPVVIDAAALLTELYINRNTDSAFKYQKLLIGAKDSLFSSEKMKQLQNISFNEQIRQQELQQVLQQNQLKYRNHLFIYSILAAFLILLIIALGIWRRSLYRKKSLLQLQQQKEQIELTL